MKETCVFCGIKKKMVDWKCKKEKYATNPVTRTEFSAESGHAVCACVRALWSKCFISSNGDRRVGEKRKRKKEETR